MIDPKTPQNVADEYEARFASLREDLKKAYADRDALRREAETLRAEVKTLERFKRRIATIEHEKQNIVWMHDRAMKHVIAGTDEAIGQLIADHMDPYREVARVKEEGEAQKAKLNALLALILVGEP